MAVEDDIPCRSDFDYLEGVEHGDAVREVCDQLEVVRDKNDSEVVFCL
jgi:hypothetical protein